MKLGFLVLLIALLAGCASEKGGDFECSHDESQDILTFYSTHSRITDPGSHTYMFSPVAPDVASVVQAVQSVLINLGQVEGQQLDIPRRTIDSDINIPTVERMLKRIAELDDHPLGVERPVSKRMVGICTHFALLSCALLREKGTPARVRSGFETHVSSMAHHDHWTCEYWDSQERRWVMFDPEINEYFAGRLKIDFDPLDLPAGVFITGAEAWRLCRGGEGDPGHFGVMGEVWIGGWDFVLSCLIHDVMALNKQEKLPWDDTAVIKKGFDRLGERDLAALDEAAAFAIAGDSLHHELRSLYRANKDLRR